MRRIAEMSGDDDIIRECKFVAAAISRTVTAKHTKRADVPSPILNEGGSQAQLVWYEEWERGARRSTAEGLPYTHQAMQTSAGRTFDRPAAICYRTRPLHLSAELFAGGEGLDEADYSSWGGRVWLRVPGFLHDGVGFCVP